MPIAFDPSARRSYILRSDRGKPASDRPVFMFRYMTRSEKRSYLELGNEPADVTAARGVDETMTLLYQRLAEVLAGWEGLRNRKGQDIVYVPASEGESQRQASERIAAVEDALIDKEIWELYWAGASEVDEADLRFFESRPSTPPATSASPDPKGAGKKSAPTRRPK